MGLTELTSVQRETIPLLLAGKDVSLARHLLLLLLNCLFPSFFY
jgi:hypothetical protein